MLLGLNANTATGGGRVAASFLIKTRLVAAKVGELYASAEEGFETVEMVAVEVKHILALGIALRERIGGGAGYVVAPIPVHRSWAGTGKEAASSSRTRVTKPGSFIQPSELTPSSLATCCLFCGY